MVKKMQKSKAKKSIDTLRSNLKSIKQFKKKIGVDIKGCKQKINSKMEDLSPKISIITLNADGLKNPMRSRDCQNGQKHFL